MAGEKMVWGIDLGQCALKALKLQLVDDAVEAVAFDIVEHPKPLNASERGGEEMMSLLAQAVETLMSRNDMAGNAVVIGVPGYQAFTRFTKLPPVDKKQLPAIVQFEAGQQIPYDIDQVIWDYQIFSEEDSPDVEVGIFCMRTEQLDRYLTPFTDAGLQPVIVQPAPLALHNFIEHDGQRDGKAVILLDIGAESTDLIVSDRGSVWTRAVPIGGANFTERLVEAFRLEFPKAETLKRSAATSKYARQIFQAMRPVYQDLIAEIQRSVGRYTQTHRDAELAKVVGMGNGFRLPGLQKFLQQNLGMKVERLSAFNRLRPGPALNAPTLNENVLSLGVAYGLAVQGLGRARVSANLLPPQIAKRAAWLRKRPWFAATAACLVLAAASLWARAILDKSALARNAGAESLSVTPLKGKAAQNAARASPDEMPARKYTVGVLSAARGYSSEWARLNSQVNEGRGQVEGMMALLDDQGLWSKIIDLFHKALPTEDEKLVKAEGLEGYIAAAEQIPRADRRQIFINSFQARYAADVASVIGPAEGEGEDEKATGRGRGSRRSGGTAQRRSRGTRTGRSGRGARGGLAGRTDGRGFVVTVEGWTPYRYSSIIKEFRERLGELGNPKDPDEAARLGFYILIPKQDQRLAQRNPDAALILAEESGKPKPEATDQIDKDDPNRDPVTGEIWVSDWVFTLRFGVVLGPSPAASGQPEGVKRSGRKGRGR